jgi:hypothetical protein
MSSSTEYGVKTERSRSFWDQVRGFAIIFDGHEFPELRDVLNLPQISSSRIHSHQNTAPATRVNSEK